MGKPTIRWTAEEIQYVRDECRKGELPPRGIAKMPGRSKMSVYAKMRELGIRLITQPRVWTPERCALLVQMWERGDSLNEMSCVLGCKPSTVTSKAYDLGMKSRPRPVAKVIESETIQVVQWPDLGPNAFKDIKLTKDTQFVQNRPQDRTLAGVPGELA